MKNSIDRKSSITFSKQISNKSSKQEVQIPIKNKKQNNFSQISLDHQSQFLSNDSILQSLQQFGLQTIIVNDDSFQSNQQIHFNHLLHTCSSIKQQLGKQLHYNNNPTPPILQSNNHKHQQINNNHKNNYNNKYIKKLQNLKNNICNIKKFIQNTINQTKEQLSHKKHENEKNIQQLHIYLQKKLTQIIKQNNKQKQQKQLLKNQINQLKITIQNINKQNISLLSKIKQLNKQQKQINQSNHLFLLSQNVKINQQMTKQYQKHTQTLRQLNKQMLMLNKQIQYLTQQNKKLKKLITQYDQKYKDQFLQTRNQQQKNNQSYHIFLQKIQNLQKQIKLLKKNQSIKDKPQLIKFTYPNQFLQVQQKQKYQQTALIQPSTQNQQKQVQRKLSLQQNDFFIPYSNEEQPRSKPMIQFQDIESPQSPLSKKSAYGWIGDHDEYCSEKLFKCRTPMSRSSLHVRIPFFLKQSQFQKSIPKRCSKNSDQINCRIMKIQCSIANQLNALGCGK